MSIRQQFRLLTTMEKIMSGEKASLLPYDFKAEKPEFRYVKNSQAFERAEPEEEGVSSEVLCDLYETLAKNPNTNAHSLMILRRGKIISEAEFSPYKSDVWHVTHSLCKTITAIGLGFALKEKLLSLDEKIGDILPEKIGFLSNKQCRNVSIRNLLTMSSGVDFNEKGVLSCSDWVKAFFDADMKFVAGESFEYNSMNTYILTYIINKRSKQSFMDYLKPRLFTPMGIENVFWETGPDGVEKGGWGMYITLEDLAKIGQLFLNHGVWNGKQLVPKGWTDEMIKPRMETDREGVNYGYQIWVGDDYYYLSGLFGQIALVMPKLDMLVVMNAGNDSILRSNEFIDIITKVVDDRIFDEAAISVDEHQRDKLLQIYKNLKYKKPLVLPKIEEEVLEKAKDKFWQRLFKPAKKEDFLEKTASENPLNTFKKEICGKTYELEYNSKGYLPLMMQLLEGNFVGGVNTVKFEIEGETLFLKSVGIKADKNKTHEEYKIAIGFEKPEYSYVKFGELSYYIGTVASFAEDEDQNRVLKLDICFLEHSSSVFIKFFFKKDDEQIVLKMDEYPSMTNMLEGLAGKIMSSSKNKDGVKINDAYTNFRIKNLANPEIIGHPENKEKKKE